MASNQLRGKTFQAVDHLKLSSTGKIVKPGETTKLDHLTEDKIRLLLDMGAVVMVDEPADAKTKEA